MFSSIEFLQKVLDTIQEGVLVSNKEGIVVGFNRQATEILELSRDQIFRKGLAHPYWQQIFVSGEPMPVEELPSSVTMRTGKIQKDFTMGLKISEKNIKWLSVNTQKLMYDNVEYVFSTFIDITEKYNLQEEVHVSKQRLKYALRGSEIGVWEYNVQTGELYFSEKCKEILEYEPGEIERSLDKWEQLIHPEDRVGLLENIVNGYYDNSSGFKVECRLLNKYGTYKWISGAGKVISKTPEGLPVRISGTIKDVTKRKSIEEQLKANEEKFRNAFHYSAIGMALVDTEGHWMDVNPALSKMLGYSKEEFSNLTFQDITFPEDLARDIEYVNQTLKREIDTYSMEKRYFHKNGNVVWALLTVSLMWDDKHNKPGFFISQIIDITSTKELITQLEVKNSQLNLTTLDLKNKIEQLEEFNRIVAHNLRGPVGNILQLGEMLHEDTESSDLYVPLLREASMGLDSTLKELIKILEVKLNKTIAFQQCSFAEVIMKVKSMLNIQIYNDTIVFINRLDVETIEYPIIYLESILYNLISNAIKYRIETNPEVKISTYMQGDRIVLEVADNGLGIDLKKYGHQIFKLKKVFHKGFDSKGLGLFILKNQIETLGGTITVESDPNRGSTFKVIF